MRDPIAKAGGDSSCQNAAPAVANQDDWPGPRLQPAVELLFDLAAQTLGTARVDRQRRTDGPEADAREPQVEGLEVPVIAEEPGQHRHEAAISVRDTNAVVYWVREKLREFSERERFGRQ